MQPRFVEYVVEEHEDLAALLTNMSTQTLHYATEHVPRFGALLSNLSSTTLEAVLDKLSDDDIVEYLGGVDDEVVRALVAKVPSLAKHAPMEAKMTALPLEETEGEEEEESEHEQREEEEEEEKGEGEKKPEKELKKEKEDGPEHGNKEKEGKEEESEHEQREEDEEREEEEKEDSGHEQKEEEPKSAGKRGVKNTEGALTTVAPETPSFTDEELELVSSKSPPIDKFLSTSSSSYLAVARDKGPDAAKTLINLDSSKLE
ncbi:unnamed protein product [Taenia asiatica]|uniref:CUE domain-containing protein n=1 Tax=Taenia asiatica TaxID=60517 RepID=A0A0R3WFU6_TAEAS|nr:unnamed protein product [Taenia asiatica]